MSGPAAAFACKLVRDRQKQTGPDLALLHSGTCLARHFFYASLQPGLRGSNDQGPSASTFREQILSLGFLDNGHPLQGRDEIDEAEVRHLGFVVACDSKTPVHEFVEETRNQVESGARSKFVNSAGGGIAPFRLLSRLSAEPGRALGVPRLPRVVEGVRQSRSVPVRKSRSALLPVAISTEP